MIPNTQQITHLVHLFPLPQLLLNPGGKITLNIFEPRYLNLLASCESEKVPMAIANAYTPEDMRSNHFDKPLIEIPHESFPFIYPEVGFGKVQTLVETDKGTKIIVVKGECKGRITQVHKGSGGFLTVEVEQVVQETEVLNDMTFLYRRLRALTREKVAELLENEREVEVLMSNLERPDELVAFYTDHICRDFELRLKIFGLNDINEKLQIIGKSLVH